MGLTIDEPIVIEPALQQADVKRSLEILLALHNREQKVLRNPEASEWRKNIAYNRQNSLIHVSQLISELEASDA